MIKYAAKFLASLLSISSFVLTLSGCGGGGAATVPPPPLAAYYVNSTTGNDANSGTLAAPFKTITMAINAASAVAATGGVNIYAAPGVYNAANGEVFPIMPTTGENLIGDIANKGLTTTIFGAGTYTVTGGDFAANAWDTTLVIPPGVIASVFGFDIAGAANGILVDNGEAVISSNTIKNQIGSSDSLTILNGGYALVTANDIQTTGWCSLGLHDPATFATLQNNTITSLAGSYGDAILVSTDANANMGTVSSPGNNTILPDPLNSVGLNIVAPSLMMVIGGNVTAVGNIWQPNVQGADNAGHYPSSFIVLGAAYVAGNNYAYTSGSGGGVPAAAMSLAGHVISNRR